MQCRRSTSAATSVSSAAELSPTDRADGRPLITLLSRPLTQRPATSSEPSAIRVVSLTKSLATILFRRAFATFARMEAHLSLQGVSGANYGPNACTQGVNDPANEQTIKDVSIRENYEGDATFLFNGGGRHELKAGYGHQSIFNDLLKGYTTRVYLQYGKPITDNFNWTSLATPSAPLCALDPTTRTPIVANGCVLGHGVLYRFGELGSGSNLNQALYVQDRWQVANRLTLNVGVRIEKEALPSFNGIDVPFSFDWTDKIAPRLGGFVRSVRRRQNEDLW